MERVEAGTIAGLRLAPKLEAGVGSPLEVSDLVGDAGGLDTMAAGLEALFSQEELGTYLIELGVKLALGVVEVSVLLDLSDVSPVVELGNGGAEGVEGRCGTIEEEEEPGGHGLDWPVEIIGGVGVELCNVLLFVFPAEALQLWTCTASAALRTDCSASFLICSLVRLIFAAEEQLFPLVLIAPLQVCAHLFSYQIQS